MINKDENVVLTRAQVRNCDKVAIEKYGIPGIVLMENAAKNATIEILKILKSDQKVAIVAGSGNNAGDGFAIARHLHDNGIDVEIVILANRNKFKGDALTNLSIIEKMGLIIKWANELKTADLADIAVVVDAMLGTGASGPPREPIRQAIGIINDSDRKTIALDVPSGLDCDTGQASELAIKADLTITFAAMKKGFANLVAAKYTGDIKAVSIGIDTNLLL
ncbi:MAG: NAD(P)H-hydrate epimerase [Phycisphaerae bacterium]|nr:NAD(P)H-hydrate epimerase [Phycisphaerae bacterium]